jgi:hypothetical protein
MIPELRNTTGDQILTVIQKSSTPKGSSCNIRLYTDTLVHHGTWWIEEHGKKNTRPLKPPPTNGQDTREIAKETPASTISPTNCSTCEYMSALVT